MKCCDKSKTFVTRTYPLGETDYNISLCEEHSKLEMFDDPIGEKTHG
jgi:hypothetical protein